MDGNKLKAELVRRGLKVTDVAKQIGVSQTVFSKKLAGTTQFKSREISQLNALLRLTPEETVDIFFT